MFFDYIEKVYVLINESNFLSSLASGLLIVLVSTFFIPRYLDWRRRPKLELYFFKKDLRKDVYSKKVTLNLSKPEGFDLKIKNNGSREYDGLYYSLYLPENFDITFESENGKVPQKDILAGTSFLRIGGYISGIPIFPNRVVPFPYKMTKFTYPTQKGIYKIYYTFSTQYGMSPWNARKINPISPPLAEEAFKYMGVLEVEII